MSVTTKPSASISLRKPTAEDGAAVHQLIASCPPLDTNSMYCNLLQCSHFSDYCIAAELDGELVGFISAYPIPNKANTLFIWQVAVSEKARGHGLATQMLKGILARPECNSYAYLETTITPDNQASWALFEGLASKLTIDLNKTVMFDKQQHFNGEHETEMLARLGPIS